GYQGGELNELGGYYVVRQSDAHAWTEIWLEGRGWARVDPTAAIAPERIELGAAASVSRRSALRRLGWIRSMSFAWDALNTRWYDFVIGYGQTTQRLFLEKLGFVSPTLARLLAATAAALVLILAAFTFASAPKRRRTLDPPAREFRRFVRR